MAATAKQFGFDAATRELWRVAESGDTDALAGILSQGVDVNARNEHGMTALMRAAHNGHDRIVHLLLEHGADPNITRNDKFTALALAAFFGHTGTVRILIENGAKTEVVTRSGTSPKMWATARTFTEAALCLEQQPSKPAAAPIAAVVKPVVIKTLKDPPVRSVVAGGCVRRGGVDVAKFTSAEYDSRDSSSSDRGRRSGQRSC